MRTGQIAHKHMNTELHEGKISKHPREARTAGRSMGREAWKARGSQAIYRSDQRKADDEPLWLAVSLEQFLREIGSSWQVSID